MKVVFRILVLLLGLVMMAGLVVAASQFAALPWLTNWTQDMSQTYFWFPLLIAGILGAALILTFVVMVRLMAVPTSKNVYVMPRQMGAVEISKRSIESGAKITMGEIPGVMRYDVHVKGDPSPHKVKLYIAAEANGANSLDVLGETIHNRVARHLFHSLEIQPQKIKTPLKPYKL